MLKKTKVEKASRPLRIDTTLFLEGSTLSIGNRMIKLVYNG